MDSVSDSCFGSELDSNPLRPKSSTFVHSKNDDTFTIVDSLDVTGTRLVSDSDSNLIEISYVGFGVTVLTYDSFPAFGTLFFEDSICSYGAHVMCGSFDIVVTIFSDDSRVTIHSVELFHSDVVSLSC